MKNPPKLLIIGPQLFFMYWPSCPDGPETKIPYHQISLMQNWVFRLGLSKKNNSELLWCEAQRFLEKLLHFATTKTGRQRRRVEPEVSALFLLTPIVKTKSNCDEIMARGQMRTKERTSTVTNLLYPALLLVMRCEMCLRAWWKRFWGFLPKSNNAKN